MTHQQLRLGKSVAQRLDTLVVGPRARAVAGMPEINTDKADNGADNTSYYYNCRSRALLFCVYI